MCSAGEPIPRPMNPDVSVKMLKIIIMTDPSVKNLKNSLFDQQHSVK